jgi:hypothetical protein
VKRVRVQFRVRKKKMITIRKKALSVDPGHEVAARNLTKMIGSGC